MREKVPVVPTLAMGHISYEENEKQNKTKNKPLPGKPREAVKERRLEPGVFGRGPACSLTLCV